jgi:hypothetical protein
MTIKGLKPTPMKVRLTIARLMQLHYDTHPKRIAAMIGLSAPYCRRLWREMDMAEWPDSRLALQNFAEMKRERNIRRARNRPIRAPGKDRR